MLARPLELDNAKEWLMEHGVGVAFPVGALNPAPPSICRLALHFPHTPVAPASHGVDEHGTPPLLVQLFLSPLPPITFMHYVWDDQIFSLHMQTSVIEDLEMCMMPHLMLSTYHIYILFADLCCVQLPLCMVRTHIPFP